MLYFKDDPVWNQTVYNQEAQAFEPAYVFVRRDQALEEFAKKAGITPYQRVPAGGGTTRMGPRAVQVKTPEYEKFIQDFESKGFQIASDDPARNDVINTYLIDPQGNKQILYTDVKDNKHRGFFGDFFYGLGNLAKELAPAVLGSLGAYGLTAGLGSLLAGSAAGAGAGAGAGAAGAGAGAAGAGAADLAGIASMAGVPADAAFAAGMTGAGGAGAGFSGLGNELAGLAALESGAVAPGAGLTGIEAALAAPPSTLGVVGPQGAFLGEGVASGVPKWDAAARAAGVPLSGSSVLDLVKQYGGDTLQFLKDNPWAAKLLAGGLGALAGAADKAPAIPASGGGVGERYVGPAAPLTRTIVDNPNIPGAKLARYAHGGQVRPFPMQDGGFVMTKRAVEGADKTAGGIENILPEAELIRGPGTGTSDSIPAYIQGRNGRTPARVSNGEAYIPPGPYQSKQLYAMMRQLERSA